MRERKIQGIFPIPIYETDLERDITKSEMDCIDKHLQDLETNISHTITKNKNVLESVEMSDLKKFFLEEVDNYFKNILNYSDNFQPYITLSWLNYTKKHQHHHTHVHENSILAGVFYVKANENHDSIKFYKNDYQQIRPNIREYNIFNSTSWSIPAKQNKLVLFPPYLLHGVDNREEDNIRISLAFNVFIRGLIGCETSITKLELK